MLVLLWLRMYIKLSDTRYECDIYPIRHNVLISFYCLAKVLPTYSINNLNYLHINKQPSLSLSLYNKR